MSPTSQLRAPTVTADIFTVNHRFSAQIPLQGQYAADVLNDRLSEYMTVKNVYVSRITKPGQIIATYKAASLVKQHITFVVLPTEADGLSQEHKYQARTIHTEDVFVTVPSFEVSGQLEIRGKFDLKATLAVGTTRFMTLLHGTAVNALYPKVSFSGPVILVSKTMVQLFGVTRHG